MRRPGAGRARTPLCVLVLAGSLMAAPACVSAMPPGLQPLGLPATLRGTVQVPAADTLGDLHARLGACWAPPAGLARLERTEITVRFALRRDGSVIGEPRVTFATSPSDSRAYRLLSQAAREAIRRCTPAVITPGLGGAIAGRPIALRFVYQGPRGQGV